MEFKDRGDRNIAPENGIFFSFLFYAEYTENLLLTSLKPPLTQPPLLLCRRIQLAHIRIQALSLADMLRRPAERPSCGWKQALCAMGVGSRN